MIYSPLTKIAGNAINGNTGDTKIERVKDDDTDAGRGSWLVGDQGNTYKPTGVPGFGGSVTEAVTTLGHNIQQAAPQAVPDLNPLDNVADWFGGWDLESWTDHLLAGITTWATGAGFGLLAGIIGVQLAKWLISTVLTPDRARAPVATIPVIIPVDKLNQAALLLSQWRIKVVPGQMIQNNGAATGQVVYLPEWLPRTDRGRQLLSQIGAQGPMPGGII